MNSVKKCSTHAERGKEAVGERELRSNSTRGQLFIRMVKYVNSRWEWQLCSYLESMERPLELSLYPPKMQSFPIPSRSDPRVLQNEDGRRHHLWDARRSMPLGSAISTWTSGASRRVMPLGSASSTSKSGATRREMPLGSLSSRLTSGAPRETGETGAAAARLRDATTASGKRMMIDLSGRLRVRLGNKAGYHDGTDCTVLTF